MRYTSMIFYHFYKKIKTFVTSCFRSRIIQAFQSRVFSKQKEFAPTGLLSLNTCSCSSQGTVADEICYIHYKHINIVFLKII